MRPNGRRGGGYETEEASKISMSLNGMEIWNYLQFDDNNILNVASLYREKRDDLIKEKTNIENQKEILKKEIKQLLYDNEDGRAIRKAYEEIIYWLKNINVKKHIEVYKVSKLTNQIKYDYRKSLEKIINTYKLKGQYIKTNNRHSESLTYFLEHIGDETLNILSLDLNPLIEEISLYEYKYNYLMDVIEIKKYVNKYKLKETFIDELLLYLNNNNVNSNRKTKKLVTQFLKDKGIDNYKFRDMLSYMYVSNKIEIN